MPVDREDPSPATTAGPRSTLARSWAELDESVQDGFAVLDADGCLSFASHRFLPVLGGPERIAGRPVERVLPSLAEDDPRQLKAELDAGQLIDFEQHVVSTQGTHHWYRITVAPTLALGDRFRAVVFARDVSAKTRRFNQLSEATAELTRVENERHLRISREIHDGPVQLLAALIFRLGISTDTGARDLQRDASNASNSLRAIIEEFSPAMEQVDGAHLELWIAPMLVGSGLDVVVDDRRSTTSGMAEAQAAFVLLYQVVRAVRDATIPRTLSLRFDDEEGGERIVLTMPSAPPEEVVGRRAARLQTIVHHAQALGGTLTHSLGDDNVRSFSMWIPKQASHDTTTPGPVIDLLPVKAVPHLPPLNADAWLEIVNAAPERMAEVTADRKILFANSRMADGLGVAADGLVNAPSSMLSGSGTVDSPDDAAQKLAAGLFVETHWRRTPAAGTDRVVRLAFSPRFTSTGTFEGLFVTTNDHSDIDHLDELHETALADLTVARHLAIEASLRRLTKPLDDCRQLIERIDRFEISSSDPTAIGAIKDGLATSLESIKSSSSVFTAPPRSADEFDAALRQSLGPILDGRRIVVIDAATSPLPTETFEVMFRIAREAVNNAVLHGQAQTILIELSDIDDGSTCTIHDDGVGVEPDQMRHQPGHLGTRSMQARAREHGGTCLIEPHHTIGTMVKIWIPTDLERQTYLD